MKNTMAGFFGVGALFMIVAGATWAQGESRDTISGSGYKRGNDWFNSNGTWSAQTGREYPLGYAQVTARANAKVYGFPDSARVAEAKIFARNMASAAKGGEVQLYFGAASLPGYPKYPSLGSATSGGTEVLDTVIRNWTTVSPPTQVSVGSWKVRYRIRGSATYSWAVIPKADFVGVTADLRFRPSADVEVVPPTTIVTGQSLRLVSGVLQFGEVRVEGQVGMTASCLYGTVYGTIEPTRFAVTFERTMSGTVTPYVFTNLNYPSRLYQEIWSMW